MSFKVGDKVSFLNEEGWGTIKEVLSHGRYKVVTEDGFDQLYREKDLVLKSKRTDYGLDGYHSEKEISMKILNDQYFHDTTKKIGKTHKGHDIWEIDLHIEELIDSHHGMSNTDIVNLQLSRFRGFIYQAKLRKIRRVIVIHGVGEGVLRHEIRSILNGDRECEYWDADYREYGYGATEVQLRYSY